MKKAHYIVAHIDYVLRILDSIEVNNGKVYAINAPTQRGEQAPRLREIWFYCEKGPAEICLEAQIEFEGIHDIRE